MTYRRTIVYGLGTIALFTIIGIAWTRLGGANEVAPVRSRMSSLDFGQADSPPKLALPPRLAKTQASIEADKPEGAGFVMKLERSKFALGDLVEMRNEFGYEKVVGKNGVFATRKSNGATFGVPNANAPATEKKAMTRNGAEHDRRVRAYFEAAGIPKDQIDGTHVSTLMQGGGTTGEAIPQLGEFVAFTSTVSRVAGGVPVVESQAYARFNVDDEVVEEGTFWPEVPSGVLGEAQALQQAMADPTKKSAYVAQLPASVQQLDGSVVVHHSPYTIDSQPSFFAAYDVIQGSGTGMVITRHFDSNGQEFQLPQELNEVALSE
jgi:hypothetical protein